MKSIAAIVVCFLIALLTTTKADWNKRQSYASNRSRERNGRRSWRGFPLWPYYEGDYIVDNWRRKCAKYNIENSVKNLITGGLKAEMNMFPYLVGLLIYNPPRIYQCGGSLITQRYVLTAAHCLYRSMEARVYLGSYTYANDKTAASVYNVTTKDFIIHERYGRQGFNDDIALIHLQDVVILSDKVKVINLAPSYMNQIFLQDKVVTTAGWGRVSDKNTTEFNVQLFYVDTRIITYEKCMCFYLPGLVSSRSHVCADGSNGVGSCDGDSGGPLVYHLHGVDYQVGITAFGSAGGCEIGFPTVYTKITNYLGWISKNTGQKLE